MKILLEQVQMIGSGIVRPEGVMALSDGTLYTADGRGQLRADSAYREDGSLRRLGGPAQRDLHRSQGACIVANIGNGQIQRLFPDGRHEVLADGSRRSEDLTPNFPLVDSRGRIWVSNSTARPDLDEALRHPGPDGTSFFGKGVLPGLSLTGSISPTGWPWMKRRDTSMSPRPCSAGSCGSGSTGMGLYPAGKSTAPGSSLRKVSRTGSPSTRRGTYGSPSRSGMPSVF